MHVFGFLTATGQNVFQSVGKSLFMVSVVLSVWLFYSPDEPVRTTCEPGKTSVSLKP